MKTYTLHLPADAHPGDAEALEGAVLVKDGFVWPAFLFTALWFFFKRLWLAGLLVLLAVMGLSAATFALGVAPGAAFMAELLLALLIGLEASSLQRRTLARRGKPAAVIVTAGSRDEAETKACAAWLEGQGAARSPAEGPGGGVLPPFRAAESIIGLFPEAERRR
jgi:hypothetical protein